MLKQIVVLVAIIIFAMVFTLLDTGGFINSFLVAFGLISVFAVVMLLLVARKNKRKE